MTQNSKKTGYRQPPSEHQFKPGRSGNPKGRPKKQPSESVQPDNPAMRAQIDEEIYRVLRVQENGKTVELPFFQALVRSYLTFGMKGTGNRLGLRQSMEWLQEHQKAAAERAEELYDTYRTIKQQYEMVLAAARKQGRPSPKVFPHPDDIILDPVRQTVSVIGPMSEEEMPYYRPAMLWRDLFLGCHAGAAAGRVPCDADKLGDYTGVSLAMACEINKALPPSLKLTDAGMAGELQIWSELSRKHYDKRWGELYHEIHSQPPNPKEFVEEHMRHQAQLAASLEKMAKVTAKRHKRAVREKAEGP